MHKQLARRKEERLTTAEEEKMEVRGEFCHNRWSAAMSSSKVTDIHTELTLVKETLTNARQELKAKEEKIKSLRSELMQRKELELRLAEKDCSLRKLNDELSQIKSSEADAINLLSEGMKRIQEMDNEIEKGKEAEAKVKTSLVAQTKQLEQSRISLEESKLEIKSLRKKLRRSEGSLDKIAGDFDASPGTEQALRKTVEILKSEIQISNEKLASSQEEEKKMKNLLEENNRLKNELKSSMEVEENNKKAMDDLALALQEVAMQSNQAKEKLSSTEQELAAAQEKIERLKARLKNTKEKYSEAKKEADICKNKVERLRLEVEESHMAWNGRETGFVECIKKAEEERNAAQEENNRLLQALRSGENLQMKAKDENQKLRDILKQAINEANVAKEAAVIAREENDQLKDVLAQKDAALNFLSQENENFKLNETAAFDNIRELKRLLAEATIKDWKTEDKEKGMVSNSPNSMEKDCKDEKDKEQGKDGDDKEQGKKLKSPNSIDKEHGRKLSNAVSLNLKDVKIPHNKYEEGEEEYKSAPAVIKDSNEDDSSSDNTEPLKGSIFDMAETPEAKTTANHHRKKSSFTGEGEPMNSEEFDHLDGAHFHETESDRSSRKKRALLRRFGDLIRRKVSIERI
ncbi:hypothetical protein SLA2020_082830 [Shorea laevis]